MSTSEEGEERQEDKTVKGTKNKEEEERRRCGDTVGKGQSVPRGSEKGVILFIKTHVPDFLSLT